MGQRLDETLDFLTKLCNLVESLFDNTIGKISRDFKQVIIIALKSEKNTVVGNINLIAVFFYCIVWLLLILKDRNTSESLYLFVVTLLMSLFFAYENNKIKIVDKLNKSK